MNERPELHPDHPAHIRRHLPAYQPTVTTIPLLGWAAPPVTLNQRGGPHVRARRMAQAKSDAITSIRHARPVPITVPVALVLHWRPAVVRRRDVDNPMPTLKAVADALVTCGVLQDDDSEHVPQMGVCIHSPGPSKAAMWLQIEEVET